MQRHLNRNTTLLLGLVLPAGFALGGHAFAADALPDRPGFGYTIDFMTGATAEALLPVSKQEAINMRPGFGYAIHFTTGYTAEALLPVAMEETMIVRPGFGYTINFFTGDGATDSLFPPGWAKQRALANQPQG